jgi:hypothetical protein
MRSGRGWVAAARLIAVIIVALERGGRDFQSAERPLVAGHAGKLIIPAGRAR